MGCNRACEAFWGDEKQLIGRTVYDVSPKDIADIYYQKDRELFKNPGIQIYETLAADRTGAMHNVIFNKATYQDKNGNLAGLIGAMLNITERKRTEEALAKSEDKFRKAFYNSMDAVTIGRLEDGMYVSINPALTRLIGYSEEDRVCARGREFVDAGGGYAVSCWHMRPLRALCRG